MQIKWSSSRFFYGVLIAALLLFFVVMNMVFLTKDLAELRHQRESYEQFSEIRKTSTRGTISPWMTFVFIEKVFNIPPGYLKDAAHIDDARYPRLTVRRYVRDHNLDQKTVIASLERAVRAYAASTTSTFR